MDEQVSLKNVVSVVGVFIGLSAIVIGAYLSDGFPVALVLLGIFLTAASIVKAVIENS